MESVSEIEKNKTPECAYESKSKRKMKTAAQLEVLENTYAAEPYPSEGIRADLSLKLNLSDRQLQMWFCQRRQDQKSSTPSKRKRQESAPTVVESSKQAAGMEFDPLSGPSRNTPASKKTKKNGKDIIPSSAPELVQLDSGTGIPIYADASKTASLCAHISHPGDEFVKYDSMIHGASLTCISQDVLKILASVNKQASDSDRDIKEARMLFKTAVVVQGDRSGT